MYPYILLLLFLLRVKSIFNSSNSDRCIYIRVTKIISESSAMIAIIGLREYLIIVGSIIVFEIFGIRFYSKRSAKIKILFRSQHFSQFYFANDGRLEI